MSPQLSLQNSCTLVEPVHFATRVAMPCHCILSCVQQCSKPTKSSIIEGDKLQYIALVMCIYILHSESMIHTWRPRKMLSLFWPSTSAVSKKYPPPCFRGRQKGLSPLSASTKFVPRCSALPGMNFTCGASSEKDTLQAIDIV